MVEVPPNDDEALTVFDHGGDAVRIVEICLKWVSIVSVAVFSRPCEGTHRPVAQNGADAMIGMVAGENDTFTTRAHSSRHRESGSERVVAVNVRARVSANRTTSSECADAAVVVDDPQAVLVVPRDNDAIRKVQSDDNGPEDGCGAGIGAVYGVWISVAS